MGVLGGRRIWTRSVHPEPPPPSGSLVTFWPSRKSLAPQGETLRDKRNRSIIAPIRPFGQAAKSPKRIKICFP